ncbi:hypothetical protein H112_08788 [Trichophyton rubrum D6]|uniref:Uncharacterized protein n=3 Tax=Trichophyton TaxID=5550 RepID=A0A080WH26_TRIRC|nr:uncharacterized protein TERG_11703 [Trichophyton rubrum CBS 118892]EZF09916.1 hypothetical protein H100_08809 [Trichophyton rubrum MR850]EZF36769.1 hypothetical protein H102_08769 [Trichophyton rubrum CBS 100081]EZF47370.1 hypothetical protein H103_08791 [Trichophyton rubrum CBS 288.86]EZF57937.1 hypothetical protein H104_08740 [Trichophyton rubrum CBS 289.86]EZF68585.1 hypothetical protein H105_08794 [Trichophyton soudanense CBS 452.61]EZF79339.1 hypothetical protein H110_08793 [Trichophy
MLYSIPACPLRDLLRHGRACGHLNGLYSVAKLKYVSSSYGSRRRASEYLAPGCPCCRWTDQLTAAMDTALGIEASRKISKKKYRIFHRKRSNCMVAFDSFPRMEHHL